MSFVYLFYIHCKTSEPYNFQKYIIVTGKKPLDENVVSTWYLPNVDTDR